MRLPDFIVAGVRKCGTTWLHQCLGEHPGIAMPTATKELFFFDRYWSRGPRWYARYFRKCPEGKLCGEVSPTYFASADAPARIKELLPNVKLVFVFRDPVERVVSLYHHMRAKGDTALPLALAIDAHPELLEEGFYARHFARFRAAFPPQAILALILDDMQAAGPDGLVPLFRFLGADESIRPQALGVRTYERREARFPFAVRVSTGTSRLLHRAGLHTVVRLVKSAGAKRVLLRRPAADFEPIAPEIVARLRALYDDEVGRLGDMLGRDLRQIWTFERTPQDGGMNE